MICRVQCNCDTPVTPVLTDEQPSIRGSVDGDATCGRVLFLDQILRRALEVIEAVLLVP